MSMGLNGHKSCNHCDVTGKTVKKHAGHVIAYSDYHLRGGPQSRQLAQEILDLPDKEVWISAPRNFTHDDIVAAGKLG
jgi:hypothetical protein